MSKTKSTKRKRHSAPFKAKVGLEALIGIKTVGQIARDYEVHPVQVTQWKGVIRERLPELFEPAGRAEVDQGQMIAQLHEKIGELTVELDWLKKNRRSWASEDLARIDQPMPRIEHPSAVRVGGPVPQRLLLRAQSGDAGESGPDAAAGRAPPEAPGLWEPTANRMAAAGGAGAEPQAGGAVAADHGHRGHLPAAFTEPSPGRASDLSVSVGRLGNHGSGPGVVCGHHLCAHGLWLHVSGGGDGLVEPLRAGLGAVQQPGGGVLCAGLAGGAGARPLGAVDLQQRPGHAVHQRAVPGGGGVSRDGSEHGRAWALDGQPLHRTALAERQVREHLSAGLCGWTDGSARPLALVPRVQQRTSPSSVGLCDAIGLVFPARRVWSQARSLGLKSERLRRYKESGQIGITETNGSTTK